MEEEKWGQFFFVSAMMLLTVIYLWCDDGLGAGDNMVWEVDVATLNAHRCVVSISLNWQGQKIKKKPKKIHVA